jgi:uncharacterized protein YbbC (DUF1343 family)
MAASAWAQTFSGAAALQSITEEAIRDGYIPGAVIVVGHNGRIVHRQAYGDRALVPQREAATVDTIYDVASLTKVIATTPAIMKLVEQGKLRLAEPVTTYLPEFQGGKSEITVRDLLTHMSGLRPDLDLEPAWSGYGTGIGKALVDKPTDPPGTKFVYSDINFELLGEIVRRLSGKPLDEFAREQIFEPLGMRDTMFLPTQFRAPAALLARIAPTEIDTATGRPFRGLVHDPTARYMGGVAGHAGLFSTADDLAKFAEMMLGMGQRAGVRLFSPLTVARFTSPATPPGQTAVRGLGWDIDSPYSSNRGDLYPIGSYGHTGFTGPAIWIDPSTQSFVVIMTNRNHPRGGRSINTWRSRVASVAAAAVSAGAARGPTRTGLDVLAAQNFEPLRGARVGLITNQTGLDRLGRRNVDLMRAAGVNLVTLFSPEHGISGREDRPDIADAVDPASGLTIRSLYVNGRTQVPADVLRGVDILVFDVQDVGARFFTYYCTMLYAMEEAAKARLPFFVLDRPNPVTGEHVEGPVLDSALISSVGCYELPLRHGMTAGEIATLANAERKLGADLRVIRMENWARGDWFDDTGLPWTDLSPNMRNLNAALLYPGVSMLEYSKDYSVGRGTDAPLEQIGAEWIKGGELADLVNSRGIAGVRAYPVRFRPSSSALAGKEIEGVRFLVTDRDRFNAAGFGLEIAYALQTLYPGKIDFEACARLIGSRAVVEALKAGADPAAIAALTDPAVTAFQLRRAGSLLY